MEAREINRIKSQAQADMLLAVASYIGQAGYRTPAETRESLRQWARWKQSEAHAYRN